MVGTLLGGVIVAASGPDLAYGLNAASFLFSAALLVQLPGRVLQEGHVESRGHWHDIAEGFRLVRQSRPLATVLVTWNLAMLAIAFANVAEVFLATVSYNAGNFGFGLMWAAGGTGAVAGALLVARWLDRWSISVVYAATIGLMALGDAAAAVSPTVWVAVWFLLVGGFGNAAAIVCNSLLVQRGAPDRLRGRAFTVIMGSNFAVLGIGMGIAPLLIDRLEARWVYGIAGALLGAAALSGYAMLRRAREPVPAPAAL